MRVGVYSTTLTENCTFDNNTAKEWGGALYNWPGQLEVNNCTITNNYAGDQGGAIITSGGLTVTNSVIVNNSALRKGGVVYIAEETPHIPSTVVFENNYISGNAAKRGSLVYVDETTATGTNFNGNYWDIDPNSDEWENAFITNDLIDNPTEFLDENKNPINPVEENTEQPADISENPETSETNNSNIVNENTTENNQNINEEIIESNENIVNNVNAEGNSTNMVNIGVGLTNDVMQSSQSSEESETTAHEITKKDVVKQSTQSPLVYLAVILILLAIFGYGYYRYNKND